MESPAPSDDGYDSTLEIGRRRIEVCDEELVVGKGTWKHAAFHVATTIATPAAYAPLPFALASLGWPLGVTCLVSATLATWYSSILIASLWKWNGKKHLTYRHLAHSIFGFWGYWSIAIFQQVASLGNNIAIHIAAGSSLKAVYKHYHEDGKLTLQHFIIFFGIFELLLSQLPDIHSLRWVNALCTFSTIGFAGTTIGVTIYNGKKIDRTSVNYSVHGSSASKAFTAFNALGTIAFSFGDAMLPEIQNTVREPAKKNMYKSISAAYSVIVLSYWQLAFTGYWAFGSKVEPYILASLSIPQWTVVMANLFAAIQISGCFQIYCRPTYAYFEERMKTNKSTSHFSLRNRLARLSYTSIYMVLVTLIAAAVPFFGDFVSICGAIGFTPLDFVFPALAYLKVGSIGKNSKLGLWMRPLNILIATWFSIVAILGCIGAVRFIVQDIKNYKFFHDM
ncbi:PREDICTED: GABA transporter 1-like [Lupinus angustifolius]|uniref:GABA transporter 1-like n=1 Tax=Lupinus angustifolius TaxID=3871 RepID=UPI00092FCDCD|nr:PREDICTED: GABA transporter 1-like [Lupinus angustifolius]